MTIVFQKRSVRPEWVVLFAAASAVLVLGIGHSAQAGVKVHRVTLRMNEFRFEPSSLHLKAGEQVALTIKNEGKVEHEWAVGNSVVNTPEEKAYRRDLFVLLKPRVTGKDYEVEKVSAARPEETTAEGESAKMLSSEVDVEPGGSATLHFKVPARAKGTWEMGCFAIGHYEAGMKGTLVID